MARAMAHSERAIHPRIDRNLFLSGDLLFDLAPGTNFEAAADPAQGLIA